jgi:hypothetical protein
MISNAYVSQNWKGGMKKTKKFVLELSIKYIRHSDMKNIIFAFSFLANID